METLPQLFIKKSAKQRKKEEEEYLEDPDVFFPASSGDEEEAVGMVTHGILQTVQNHLNRDREEQKKLWRDGYATWTNEEFKDSLRMHRETFNFILCRIEQGIIKEPTVMVSNPIEPHRQLALTIYRTAHGCSFKVFKYIFGVSQSLATQTFNKVLTSSLHDVFIKLPSSENEWVQE